MDWFYALIGEPAQDPTYLLTWWQMTIRAVLLFVAAVALVRLGAKRIFGKHTVLDIVLAVIIGSNFSRALTGNAPFFQVIIASAALITLHDLLARAASRSDRLAGWVKGERRQLVRNGEVLWEQMEEAGLGSGDLGEAMRTKGHPADFGKIKEAYLERSGDISIVTQS
jgi:uncharacterized membrane protein YcaP (DUF421 family)